MGRILIIARREITSLFVSPIAYVVLCLFMFFMGIVFSLPMLHIFGPGEVIELRTFTDWSRFTLFFVVPLMTMGLFSDEYRSGRIEMLRTSPITEFHLVAGKFIGAMVFYLVLVASTLLFLVILRCFGRPDYGQVFSCYLGMCLMGCMFVAVGLFFSAITREPIIAAMLSVITLGILSVVNYLADVLPQDYSFLKLTIPIRPWIEFLSVRNHIGNFTRGSLELDSVLYFLGIAATFLFWTYLILESKKWR